MKEYINGIDFHNMENMKYWAPPASWSEEKKKTEIKNAIFSNEYLGALKVDGALYKFIKDEDGNMELLGRSKGVNGDYTNKIGHVPHLRRYFEELPNGTCLLGEIYLPSKEGSNNTTSIMGCLEEKAIARQEAGEYLNYYVFDVLAFNGLSMINMPAEFRFNMLLDIENVKHPKEVHFAHYVRGNKLWDMLQNYLSEDREGMVIYKDDSEYLPGKRKAHMTIKIKKELKETIDCFIIGANPPTRKYEGKQIDDWMYWENLIDNSLIHGKKYNEYFNGAAIEPVTKPYYNKWPGSLKLGVYKDGAVVHIGNLSGLSEDILANWRGYIDKVVEVSGMEVYKDTGAIRHPKFVKFREDINKEDCTFDKYMK